MTPANRPRQIKDNEDYRAIAIKALGSKSHSKLFAELMKKNDQHDSTHFSEDYEFRKRDKLSHDSHSLPTNDDSNINTD